MTTPSPRSYLYRLRSHTRWALLVVALVEVSLFAQQRLSDWPILVRIGTPQTLAGEGLVIRGDGFGYYAWLRSLLMDGDWSFADEYDEHYPVIDGVPTPKGITPVGRREDPFSVGPACVWSVTVVPGHLVMRVLRAWGLPWAADGYSLPYQLLVGGTTLLAALLGLFFLYGICLHFARPARAALAAAVLTLGSTVVYYSAAEVTMGHGLGTVALAGFVWYWLKSFGSERPLRWLVVGGLLGVASLMRWQLATFAVLPLGEGALSLWHGLRARPRRFRGWPLLCVGLAGLGAVAAFSPQMLAWRCVYGRWLVSPMPLCNHWDSPSLWEVLGAQDRGLFYWTPVTLLACVGFLRCRRGVGHAGDCPALAGPSVGSAVLLLLLGFVLQVYVLASIRGTGVFLGCAYGFRQLTEATVVLGPGLALLLEAAPPRRYRVLCLLGCLLVLWNLVLICQYRHFLLPQDGGAPPARFLANLVVLIHRHPVALAGLLVWPTLLAVLSGAGSKQSGAGGTHPASSI